MEGDSSARSASSATRTIRLWRAEITPRSRRGHAEMRTRRSMRPLRQVPHRNVTLKVTVVTITGDPDVFVWRGGGRAAWLVRCAPFRREPAAKFGESGVEYAEIASRRLRLGELRTQLARTRRNVRRGCAERDAASVQTRAGARSRRDRAAIHSGKVDVLPILFSVHISGNARREAWRLRRRVISARRHRESRARAAQPLGVRLPTGVVSAYYGVYFGAYCIHEPND